MSLACPGPEPAASPESTSQGGGLQVPFVAKNPFEQNHDQLDFLRVALLVGGRHQELFWQISRRSVALIREPLLGLEVRPWSFGNPDIYRVSRCPKCPSSCAGGDAAKLSPGRRVLDVALPGVESSEAWTGHSPACV